MQIFKNTTTFDFMGSRKLALIVSSVLIAIALLAIVVRDSCPIYNTISNFKCNN